MQQIDNSPAQLSAASDGSLVPVRRGGVHWRYLIISLLLVGMVCLGVLPPLLNVSRFKRRIVTSLAASIGRPIHLDNVSLILLPFPSFKLENFVVEEDPAFGAEPIIHSNNVVATLRFSSLWRRKVEFSRINLQEPSINLVHTPDGKWNIESILLQAARIPVAPTAQAKAGPVPRFPYIEATGARVNIKYGNEKLPFSLTEADFALWLPRQQQWRIRLEAKPTRTDTSASDTGTISLEGTLDHAERFELIPIELSGEWKNVPLGEASRVVIGHDAGLRGNLKLNLSAHGTIGKSIVRTTLQLTDARRAEFVPPKSLDLRAECQATATETFHALHEFRCSWPPPAAPSLAALTGDLGDVHNPAAAPFELGTPGLPAATLLEWLRIASPRVSPDVTAKGSLAGSIARRFDGGYFGQFTLKSASLAGGPIGETPVILGDITIASATAAQPQVPQHHGSRKQLATAISQPASSSFSLAPTTITLGGKEPALLEGRFDQNGYSLHLTGNVLPSRLFALSAAIPQFGDGLGANLPAQVPTPSSLVSVPPARDLPIHVDLTSTRLWGGGQSWAKTPAKPGRSNGARRR